MKEGEPIIMLKVRKGVDGVGGVTRLRSPELS
jgi:hypothetical protein